MFSTYHLIDYFGKSNEEEPTLIDKIFDKLIEHSIAGMEEILGEIGGHRIEDIFRNLDEKFIKPVVLYKYESQEPQFMQVKTKYRESSIGLFF